MKIRSIPEQNRMMDICAKERIDTIIPEIMKQRNVECWLVASKEYHEDLVFPAITPGNYLTARRVTMMAFILKNDEYHKFSLSLPDKGLNELYEPYWNFGKETQEEALNRLLEEYDPANICLNTSKNHTFSDGLSMGLYQWLQESVNPKYVDRFMCDDLLPVKVLEIRTPTEIELMPEVCEAAFGVIEKAFSYEVITPGVTTTEDIENFMKQEVKNLGLDYWFNPTIDFQRLGDDFIHYEGVVEKGDLLHCDFGIRYMNLCTDTQRLAYLLKDDETELPKRIRIGFANTNDFQDIVCSKMTAGKTGNDVFTESIEAAKGKPYHAVLYSHPTNIYGHGPGPIIGLWNNQNPIPVRGDIPVDNNTVYALELQTRTTHTDGITYTYHAEETVLVTEQGVTYLYPGRDKVYLVK